MSNTYKATTPFAEAIYQPGEFEADFTPAQEQDALAAGVEIVPRAYRVLSDNYNAGEQGETVDLALLIEPEAALIQGGHIERVEAEDEAEAEAEDESEPAPEDEE
jgi:hypothetical protein